MCSQVARRKYEKLKELIKDTARQQATHVGDGEVAVKANMRVEGIEQVQAEERPLTKEERKELKKQKKMFKKDEKKAKKAAKEKQKERQKERQEGSVTDAEFFSPV